MLIGKKTAVLSLFIIIVTAALAVFLLGSDLLPVLQVWSAMLLLGIAFLPVSAWLFRSFSDRGWIQSKLIGLTLAGYVSFVLILTHTIRFLRLPLFVCTIFLAAAVWTAAFRCRNKDGRGSIGGIEESVRKAGRETDLTLIIVEELLFFGLLAAWCYLYGFDTLGVLHNEGPMDYGILSSLMRSQTLPPADMWDSEMVFTNYYYGGQYFTAFLTKLTGMRTNEMYTVAKAMIPAASGSIVFSIVWHLMKDRKPQTKKALAYIGGLLSSLLLICSSNLHYLVFGLFRLIDFEGYDYWSTTRYIEGTITEIPAFSFILGDFHAHVINMMFVYCFLSILYAWMKAQEAKPVMVPGFSLLREMLLDPYLYFIGLFITVFFMNNIWDAPIYVLVFVMTSGFMALRSREEKRIRKWLLRGVLLAALLFILSAPFRTSFTTASSSGLALAWLHSEIEKLFILWGLHLFVIAAFLQYTLYIHWKEQKQKGFVTYLRGLSMSDLFVLMAGLSAVCVIAIPEIVWIMDIFGGRMNTMFKTYFQSSLLLDMACGYVCLRLLADARKVQPRVFAAAALGLFLISCGYFHMGVTDHYGDVTDRSRYVGLDAESFLDREMPEDADAIRWLEENVEGQPHIVETTNEDWINCGRVASLTGLPTVLGWYTHEVQFTADREGVNRRKEDVASIYSGSDEELVRHLLRQYRIRYIFVGKEEQRNYEVNHNLLKNLGTVVYSNTYGTYILEIDYSQL